MIGRSPPRGWGGGAGTVPVLELVGSYKGAPHTVRIKLNSYVFNLIFHKDRQPRSRCISTTMASASLAGVLRAASASPTSHPGEPESLAPAQCRLTRVSLLLPGSVYTPERGRSEGPTAARPGQPPRSQELEAAPPARGPGNASRAPPARGSREIKVKEAPPGAPPRGGTSSLGAPSPPPPRSPAPGSWRRPRSGPAAPPQVLQPRPHPGPAAPPPASQPRPAPRPRPGL